MGKRRRTQPTNFHDFLWIRVVSRLEPERSRTTKLMALLAFGVSACANNPSGMQGRWFGTVIPVFGTCDSASQAVLTIERGKNPPYTAAFAPTSGVLTLHGSSDGVDQVAADLHTTGVNHQPYILAFTGTRNGDIILGTYITQRCRSDVKLQRK